MNHSPVHRHAALPKHVLLKETIVLIGNTHFPVSYYSIPLGSNKHRVCIFELMNMPVNLSSTFKTAIVDRPVLAVMIAQWLKIDGP